MLYNRTKGVVVTSKVRFARGFWRGIGLMLRKSFDGALIFENVGTTHFHGWFCRFPILLLCMDGRRVKEKKILYPWHVIPVSCETVIELDARRKWPVDVGDELVWEVHEDEGRCKK